MSEPVKPAEPPAGMSVVTTVVHIIIGTEVGPLTVLARRTWLPAGVQPTFVKFTNIDPDKRLPVLGDLGVIPEWEVRVHEWDFDAAVLNLHLKVTRASARLSEESIALLIGLYKEAGWDYLDDKAKEWPARLVKHKEMLAAQPHGHAPDCPNHPANQIPHGIPVDLSGVNVDKILDGIFADPDDEPLPPTKKKRKKKRKPNPGGKTDGGEEAPDAGGE
jgi:hypothetical protein